MIMMAKNRINVALFMLHASKEVTQPWVSVCIAHTEEQKAQTIARESSAHRVGLSQ